MSPTISVIVPAKNAQEFIRQCLDSIYRQYYHDYEVIVLVAESSDDTLEIACEFELLDPRFRVVVCDENIGKTRRIGVEMSRGEWIAFVDADDMIHPWYLLNLFACTGDGYLPSSQRIGPAIVMCDWTRDENTAPRRSGWETITGRTALERLATEKWFDYTVVWGKLWHRDVFSIFNFPDAAMSEEQELVHMIYSSLHLLSPDRDYIVHILQPLYMWRNNPNSLTNQRFTEGRLYHIECGIKRLNYYDALRDENIASLFSQRLVLDCMWTQAELQKAGCSADSIYRVKLIRKKTLRRIMRDRLIPLRRKLRLAVVCSTPKFARVFGDSVYDW